MLSSVTTLYLSKSSFAREKLRSGSICSTSILDRKSTRLNSSHDQISYAVFCLKKKNSSSPFSRQSLSRVSISTSQPFCKPPITHRSTRSSTPTHLTSHWLNTAMPSCYPATSYP